MSETYFVNLFSEILLNYGPSPHQHYAFICKDEANQFDIQFLQVRLGITPVVYGEDYSSLPDALSSILPKPIDSKYDTRQTVTALSGFSYWIPRASVSKGSIHFQLCFSELRQPLAGQAVVLSAGRLANGMPALGNMGKSFLGIFRRTFPSFGIHMQKWEAVRSSRSLFRLVSDGGRFPVFALIAREPVTAKRDLMSIKRTTVEALNILEDLGEFEHVSMGILAAGDPSFAHPTFPFMGQLAGIREFTASELGAPQNKALTSLLIDIVDLSVWRPILSGRLPVRELLSSDLVRVFVRIQYDLERWDSFAISVPFHYTVRDVLSLYQILDEGVAITLYPSAIAQKSDHFSAPIFPLMTIQVNGRHFGERTNQ